MRKLLILSAVLLGTVGAPASAAGYSPNPGEGWFEFKCGVSLAGAPIDPLVFPGTVGVSHEHQFAGNESINENSTNESLRANPSTTCLDNAEEKARTPKAERRYGNALWYPRFFQLIDGERVPLTATRVTSGYSVGHTRDFASIQAFTDDLNFIAGRAAGGPSEINGQSVYKLLCPSGVSVPGTAKVAPLCNQPQLRVQINAPDCWDGVRSSAADNRDHMAYSKQAAPGNSLRVCPSTHPVLVPAQRILVELPTRGGSGLTVATGSGAGANTAGDMSTLHYDYMSAVAREVDGSNTRSDRTRDCLNQNEYCGGSDKPVPGHGGGI